LLTPADRRRSEAAPQAIVDVSNPYPAAFTRFEVFTGIAAPNTYTIYPYSTQGKVFFTQKDPKDGVVKNFVCSASVMENSAIMTAGHCLHAGTFGAQGWSTNLVFVPAYYDGSAPLQQWTPAFLRVFTSWYNGADSARDVGGAPMNVNAAGQQLADFTGWLGLAWDWGYQQHYNALGYPQAAPFNGQRLNVCQSTVAYTETAYSPATMAIGCDMTGGSSGGGWIKDFGTGNSLNGVNSYKRIIDGTVLSQEMFSPYFDSAVKTTIWDCVTQRIGC
jgi:V8-like Glu-specific endopeptidase